VFMGLGIALAFLQTKNLNSILRKITDGLKINAQQVNSAASELLDISQELADSSAEQAATIETTSTALEEMTTTSKETSSLTRGAETLMNQNIEKSGQSLKALVELTSNMAQIEQDSDKIKTIINTIDGIAFKTNLLALNAAVEAARAGEAGAGFAVVADEVRNLALRAADAARNTTGQIENISHKIEEAMEMVFKTIDEFAKVDENTGKVSELLAEISAASGEQSQGIEQINLSVAEMDKVVQQNAANAEESASASEQIFSHARDMKMALKELMVLISKRSENENTKADQGGLSQRIHSEIGGRSDFPVSKGRAGKQQLIAEPNSKKPGHRSDAPLDLDF
ncbi:MAG TPA: methyl-accepting chemotaxis protein, partial [Desulfobacteria bacterium]|nr:methyl-accepting chemotaxis protein [Desulfobacteria bacterium]